MKLIYTLLFTASFAALSVAADWPVYRGNPAMTGVTEAKLPNELDTKWTFKTKNAVEAAPVIQGDFVYVASTDKTLYALDLKTGKEKWSFKCDAPLKASAAVKGDKVFVADTDGKVYGLNAADGKKLWMYECPGEVNSGANFTKDLLLVASYDGTLTALNYEGKKVWEYKIDQPINGSPAVTGNLTFVAGCDSILHVVDANTGKKVGEVDIGGQAGATAAIAGTDVYVGTMANQLVALSVKEAKEPKGLWKFEAVKRQQPFYASAAVTEKLVVAGSRDKKLYALERATGKEAWSFTTDGMVDSPAVIVGNRVYVGCLSTDGNFYVLDLNTGNKIQELNLDSAVCGSPAVAGDCILVGTDKGTLYCLGAK